MRIFTVIMCLFLTFSSVSFSYNVTSIDKAIIHIIKKGIPKFKIRPWKKHPYLKDERKLNELSASILDASLKYDIPPMLLVAISFREGSFHGRREGKLGEKSTFQIVKSLQKSVVKYEPDCKLTGPRGASMCAAALLARYREKCGDLQGAFLRYATGRNICKPDSEHLKNITRDRFGIAEFLENTN